MSHLVEDFSKSATTADENSEIKEFDTLPTFTGSDTSKRANAV